MQGFSIFKNITENDVNKMLMCFNARKITYKKDRTIINNISNTDVIGIIMKGTAELIRYEYNGNKTIIETFKVDSVFGNLFTRNNDLELSIVTSSECEVLFIDYSSIIQTCYKNCQYHKEFINNIIQIMANKMVTINERIEVLTKRTIREKLQGYFSLLSKKNSSKIFILPFSYTDLADYLSIDRSAMMREIKYLKEENFLKTNGRKITILY